MDNLGKPWATQRMHTQTEFNCITLWFHGFYLLTLNILENSGTFLNFLEHSLTFFDILEHSRTFWNILEQSGTVHYYIECCKKVEFQLGGHTHTQTLGLVGLRLRSQKS